MAEPPSGTVTLLFTDIESSTQLLRLLDDRYAAVLGEHERLLRDAFAAHHGYEVDTQGDAFFVAFARASDAVAAAVAAQRALSGHPWPAGVTVRVRMGLHTGQPSLQAGRYIGLDVHRAARIASAAHGGQILLSQATAELVRDRLGPGLALHGLGAYAFRDFDPEYLYQLLAEDLPAEFPPPRLPARAADEPGAASAGTLRFVDRLRETEMLRARLAGALTGRGGLVLLGGDAGIGKTRLAEELAAEAARREAEVLWGRCWESEGAPPFWPWVQILRGLVRGRPPLVLRAELGAGGALIAELVPELRERLPDPPPTPVMEPEAARFQLFDTITAFLTNVARAQPLLLVLDDLHWADKPSLLLLQFLLQNLGDARLLIVGTYRESELDRGRPLAEVLPALRRERAFDRLAVAGLTEDAVGELIAAFFDQRLGPRGAVLTRVLAEETEGNPFFVQEELRYLVENERIFRREGRWDSDVTSIAELELPEAVREVLDRRLARLSAPSRELLTEAAVVGREFDLDILRRMSGAGEEALDLALEAAEAARIVEAVPRTLARYRFSHVLFQEALYTELPARRRARLHLRAGEALEQQYAGRPQPHLSELAYHFVQAASGGAVVKAIDYARRAGEQALATYAYEEAVRQFETALRVLEEAGTDDATLRCDLLLALADALLPSGEVRRAADEVAPAALKVAEALGDGRRAFDACRAAIDALLRFGISVVAGTDEFETWLARAAQYAAPGSREGLWIALRRHFAQGVLGYPGRTWEARLESLERARALGDETLLCLALNTLLAAGTPRQWAELGRIAREFAAHDWQPVPMTQRAAFCVYCGYTLLDAGDRPGWEVLRRQVRLLAEQTRDPYARLWTFYFEIERLQLDGRLEENLALQERVLQETRSMGMQVAGLTMAARLGARARFLLGRADEQLGLLDQLRQDLRLPPNAHDASVVLCQAHLGRREEVRAALDWLLTPEGALADREVAAIVRYLEAAVLIEHQEAAAALAATLTPAAQAATSPTAYTCAARHLTAAAALLGDQGRALAYARQALAVSERIQNRPEIALARLRLAELLQGEAISHQPSALSSTSGVLRADKLTAESMRAEALEHLRFAIGEFRAMKMQPSLERAAALQRRLPSMNSPTDDSSK